MDENRGIIYIMECISLPGIVKIGKTDTYQFDERMRKLETDGYRHEVLRRAYAIEVPDYDEKEKLLDRLFAKSRVGDSELFALPKNDAVELLKSFEGRQIYPRVIKDEEQEIDAEQEIDTTPEIDTTHEVDTEQEIDNVTSIYSKRNTRRRRTVRNFRFSMIGLSVGTKIHFDPADIEVEIASNRTVQYQGEEYTLSSFTKYFMPKDLRNESGSYRGSLFFSYNGKTLQEMRDEREGIDKDDDSFDE